MHVDSADASVVASYGAQLSATGWNEALMTDGDGNPMVNFSQYSRGTDEAFLTFDPDGAGFTVQLTLV
ncbi:hypothetical protein [Cryobacterium sp. TMT4-10]|uniref:hypothetical protein n=1 Tax=Cryobacterium sp. TMT4-10 TaxID=1259256 RepID=UPI001069B8AE|nr:hypothetical protein [Cryobacterium sp. TMT4-10]TFD13142.1 hypothetical protein E3T42_14325 [Cryobacterium sp. TMT4-10]